jgi:lipid II:glycine glycyltransferase (peptidoglycan interpeptide bridge formation enzyme)
VRLSINAESWDADLETLESPAPLLQSWAWGEVQARAGWTVERARLDGAMASVQLRGFGRLREAYAPRGPVPARAASIDALVEWARSRKVAKLKVEPDAPAEFASVLQERGLHSVSAVQPPASRILTLGPEADMLAGMRQGTRYNIRLAEKKGVVVEEGRDAAELERQSAAVEARESIDLPRREYYELLLTHLPWCRIYVARLGAGGEPLAALLVARHGGRGYNLFAGRSGKLPELKANELMHWTAIRECARAGLKEYDLWGVPPPCAGPEHPWHGLGGFKAGLGGTEVVYAGAWELELSKAASRLLDLGKSALPRIMGLRRNIS